MDTTITVTARMRRGVDEAQALDSMRCAFGRGAWAYEAEPCRTLLGRRVVRVTCRSMAAPDWLQWALMNCADVRFWTLEDARMR